MDTERPQITVGADALSSMRSFVQRMGFRSFYVVADANTHRVLGERVEKTIRDSGWDASVIVLTDDEVAADARSIQKVLIGYDATPRLFVAVGSGTITDITRFVSHRTGSRFISLPTAPSVDGFTSTNVPMIVDGIKKSFTAHAPLAIFADTSVLSEAPRAMIAAGFGDMMGKYTSVADWRLGHLLWDQPYDEPIARRALAAADACSAAVAKIGKRAPEGIAALMDALIESGFCMTDFGSSLPASGAEHHFSHCWEMKLLREGRPAILHGAKVGVATVLVAELYERVRATSRGDVFDLLSAAALPDREAEVGRIVAAFGAMAPEMVRAQARFLDLSPEAYDALKRRIVDCWPAIQDIAADVPSPSRIAELIARAGGPTTAGQLGLSSEELSLAKSSAHYLRGFFTVSKLMRMLSPETTPSPA